MFSVFQATEEAGNVFDRMYSIIKDTDGLSAFTSTNDNTDVAFLEKGLTVVCRFNTMPFAE